jgi:hypothetical protein
VWDLVSDFGNLKRWHPLIVRCEANGTGEGSVRTIHFADWWVSERLDALNQAQYILKYTAIDSSRCPFIGVSGSIRLSTLDGERTQIDWTAGLDSQNPHAAMINAGLEAYYPTRLSHLRQALGLNE